ncbi:MAG: GNAT family N-acetyltransferase [Dehalococcoidia bacterium]|nr:GNAT family N-acetyltransferase [Dehalococcoidia bacterium]
MTRITGSSPEVWARGRGVVLTPRDAGAPLTDGLRQALRDGVERGHDGTAEGDTPALPLDTRTYTIEVGKREVGLLALRLDWPNVRTATVLALVIDPGARGHAYAARALFTAEQALADDIDRWLAVVPRTNGRGLYFMLRCGYAPLLARPLGASSTGVTWFERGPRA